MVNYNRCAVMEGHSEIRVTPVAPPGGQLSNDISNTTIACNDFTVNSKIMGQLWVRS